MHLRTRPTFSVVTSSASSSSRMCFFIPVSDMPKGSASSLIVALPAPSCSSTARRVGSAGAAKGRVKIGAQYFTIRLTVALVRMQSDSALELGITARWIVAALRLVRGSARLPDDQELGGGIETLLPKL